MKTLSKSILLLLFVGVTFAGFANAQNEAAFEERKGGFVKIQEGYLYYQEMGQGTPIIVLHGGPGLDQGYLQPQLFQLAATHRLIFYDQRGSGKSLETKLDEQHIDVHQFVEDLEALRKSLGLNTFILMGHSWGGFLAMHYAAQHQDHLISLILLNSLPADFEGQKAFMDEFTVRTKKIHSEITPLFVYEDLKKLDTVQIENLYRQLFSVYVDNPEKAKDLNLNFSVASAQSGFKVMQEMSKSSLFQPAADLFPKLKTLTIPTFILHGKQDIIPAWTSEKIKNAIPNAEIVILDHCGHFPYIEQPAQFFSEINRFLKKTASE